MTAESLPPATVAPDRSVLARLRAGDEVVYGTLVESMTPGMLRAARSVVGSSAVAEEVVQETWLAVVEGLDNFERRSNLKTWIYRILFNTAASYAARERRSIPVAVTPDEMDGLSAPAWTVYISDEFASPRHWAQPPRRWGEEPEDVMLRREISQLVGIALSQLSHWQRVVVKLHDVDGLSTSHISQHLQLESGHVRLLLHRGRTRMRQMLLSYLASST